MYFSHPSSDDMRWKSTYEMKWGKWYRHCDVVALGVGPDESGGGSSAPD